MQHAIHRTAKKQRATRKDPISSKTDREVVPFCMQSKIFNLDSTTSLWGRFLKLHLQKDTSAVSTRNLLSSESK